MAISSPTHAIFSSRSNFGNLSTLSTGWAKNSTHQRMPRQQHNGSKDAMAVPWQFRGNLAGKGSTGGGHGNGASHEVAGGRDGSCEIVPVGLIRTIKKNSSLKNRHVRRRPIWLLTLDKNAMMKMKWKGMGKHFFFEGTYYVINGAWNSPEVSISVRVSSNDV